MRMDHHACIRSRHDDADGEHPVYVVEAKDDVLLNSRRGWDELNQWGWEPEQGSALQFV